MSDDKRERLGEILGQVLTPIQEKLNTLDQELTAIHEVKQQLKQIQNTQSKLLQYLQELKK